MSKQKKAPVAVPPAPRAMEEIQKEFEATAAHLGQVRYQRAVMESQEQDLMKKMLGLNQEAAAAKGLVK